MRDDYDQDYDPNGLYQNDPNGSYQDDPNGPYQEDEVLDYPVGYGKPPEHTRFKKGESGNPSGRPRGAKTKVTEGSLMDIVQEEAARSVVVKGSDGEVTISMSRALVRVLMQKGTKGDSRAMRLFFEMLEKAEQKPDSKYGTLDKPIVYWVSWSDDHRKIHLLEEEVELVKQYRQQKADEETLKPKPSPGPQALLDQILNPKYRIRDADDDELDEGA